MNETPTARASTCKVLIAQEDPRLLETMVHAVVQRFDAHLTCVGTAEDALDIEMIEPHDIVVAELDLPGMDGITLAKHLKQLSDRPVILLADEPRVSHAIAAMRAGVDDFFPKPVAMDDLLDSMSTALQIGQATRRLLTRHRHLRQLVRRVLRERRELNSRIDLICRDLVGAHRRLVHRVIDRESRTRQLQP